jgi:hypothetical protein
MEEFQPVPFRRISPQIDSPTATKTTTGETHKLSNSGAYFVDQKPIV